MQDKPTLTGNLVTDIDNILLNHLRRYPDLVALLAALKERGYSREVILKRLVDWGTPVGCLTYNACEAQLELWNVQ